MNMEFNEVREKIASRGHWFVIVGPGEEREEESTEYPRDKYNILKQLGIQVGHTHISQGLIMKNLSHL